MLPAKVRIVHTLTWDPPEIAGKTVLLDNGTTLYLHGTGPSMFQDIFESLNVQMEELYTEYDDAINLVANNTADIGSLTIVHANGWANQGVGTRVVYLHPVVRDPSYIFYRQPPSANLISTMLEPFSTPLWLCLIAFFYVTAIIMNLNQQKYKHMNKILRYFITTTIFFIQLSLSKYPLNAVKLSNFVKFTKLSITILSFFAISIYNAKVTSIFVLKDEIIKSVEDLIKHKYVLYSYSEIHINRIFGRDPALREFVSKNAQPVRLNTIESVIGRNSDDPRKALLTLPDGFYPQAIFSHNLSESLCLMSRFESKIKSPRCPYISKTSPFRDPVNIRILQMTERGLNYRLQVHHKELYKFVCPQEATSVNALTMHHVSFAFATLIAGACSCIVVNCFCNK